MITPEQLAASGRESGHQKALFCWAALTDVRTKYPELKWMFAIPNGGMRNIVTASNLVAEGVKKGVPDIFLPVRRKFYSGLFIELKRPSSVGKAEGRASDEQMEFMAFINKQGFLCTICIGWEHAKVAIIAYLEFK